MFSDSTVYSAPFYLLRSHEDCEQCGTSSRVVALVSGHEEPLMFSFISSMPDDFLLSVTAIHPDYELAYVAIAETSYYCNVCNCGAIFDDFSLFCEPGGAFFPNEDDEAARIDVIKLPFEDTYPFTCSPGMGTAGIILEHGKRVKLSEIK